MINLILFGSETKAKQLKMDLSYQYHQASTEKLIIYNQGSKKVDQVTVSVYNQMQQAYNYQFKSISLKTAVLLDYKKNADLNNNYFEGQIEKVILKVSNKQLVFKADGDKFVRT
jgi:hypothetical protein